MTTAEALARLKAGNRRFLQGIRSCGDEVVWQRARALKAQHPFAAIVGCADSRVPPGLIFDQCIGDLFTARIAGNIASEGMIGTLEYAVAVLQVPLIVVLGHDYCGAVAAAVEAVTSGKSSGGKIDRLLDFIRPAVARAVALPGDTLTNAVRANVEQSVAQIRSTPPVLDRAVAERRVWVIGAVYHLESGVVEFFDADLTPEVHHG
jgi:carbonic anhydrase